MQKKLLPALPYFILLFIAIFAYWQVAFMQYAMKWDAIDQFFPIRHFISECLRSGNLPLWCPYSNLGYPVHADPQSGSWYPIVWFFSIFSTYSIYTVSLEYILHIFLAGCGMFLLTSSLNLSKSTALFTAIAYMLSGVFVGNAQHTTWIISATWLPFILRSFLKLNTAADYKHTLLFALFFFMMMTGGYPAFVFVLVYILLAIFIVIQFQGITGKNLKPALKTLRFLFPAGIIAVLLCSVSIISILEIMPYFSRGGGIPLHVAHFNPFSPKAAISLITPFATIKDYDFFDTDQSMANGYIGIITLAFFVLFIIKRKSKQEWLFFGIAVFCLLTSFGAYFFLRGLLYEYLPLMDSFRFPSLFRIYFILFSIICAGFAFENFIKNPEVTRQRLLISTAIITLCITAILIYNLDNLSLLNINVFDRTFYINVYQNTSLNSRLAFQALIQLCVMAIFLVLVLKKVYKNRNFTTIFIILIALEMILAVQINIPVSVVNEHKPALIHKFVSGLPKGFVVPPANKIKNFSDAGLITGPLWRNMNFFYKRPAWDGFNNFTLNNYQVFINSNLKDSTLQNPLVYLSDKVYSTRDLAKTSGFNPNSQNLFFDSEQFEVLKKYKFRKTAGDTAYITDFKANSIEVKIKTKQPQLLTLLQCYYQGWQAEVDGKNTRIFSPNLAFISIQVPSGEHVVKFKYNFKPVIAAFYVSAITLFGVLVGMLLIYFKDNKKEKAPTKL